MFLFLFLFSFLYCSTNTLNTVFWIVLHFMLPLFFYLLILMEKYSKRKAHTSMFCSFHSLRGYNSTFFFMVYSTMQCRLYYHAKLYTLVTITVYSSMQCITVISYQKDKSQNTSLHHVVLSKQFNHTVYPQHYSNAKCIFVLLTLSLTQLTTLTNHTL